MAQAFLSSKTQADRRGVAVSAIDEGLLSPGSPVSTADRIFRTACDTDRPAPGELKDCDVELLPYYKLRSEPALKYINRWHLNLTYDASGTIASFGLSNANVKG